MNYNKTALDFEQDLLDKINNSRLHVVTVKYILDKVSSMVNDALIKDIEKEEANKEE